MDVEDIVKHVFPVDATTGKLEKMQMQKIRTYCDIRSDAYQHKRFKITEVKEHREKAVTAYKSTSGSRSAAYNRGRSGYNSRYQHNATGNDGHNSSRVFDDKSPVPFAHDPTTLPATAIFQQKSVSVIG